MRSVHANRRLGHGMVLVLWSLGACATVAADQPYPVYQLQQAPDLRAEAYEEAVWRNIPWATGFFKLGTSRKVEVQTSFKVGFTEQAVYFLIKCREPEMDKIKAVGRDDNPAIWREDSVEVFVHPQDTEHIFQVLTNAAGARANMLNDLDMYNAADIAGQLCMTQGLSMCQVARGGTLMMLTPIFSLLAGTLLLGEWLTLTQWLGSGMVMIASIITVISRTNHNRE